MICPDCGHENRIGELVCENCGADLYDSLIEQVTTKKLATDKLATRMLTEDGMFTSSRPIVMYVNRNDSPVAVERKGDLVIGRHDPNDPSVEVNIDLEHYGAGDKGVSRQHLMLHAEKSPPVIIDMDSSNGTFVNGQRLIAQTPHVLRSGDEVRIGRLPIRIYFK
ncbi:MAG: FHA domain-containing protein [Aggregatilineales bacterium]